jgi:hypothetical protein
MLTLNILFLVFLLAVGQMTPDGVTVVPVLEPIDLDGDQVTDVGEITDAIWIKGQIEVAL